MSNLNEQSTAVQRQVVLPFWKSVEISVKSIRVRFFRSLITTMSLVLAIAFLSFVKVSNNMAEGLLSQNAAEITQILVQSGYDLNLAGDKPASDPKQRWIVMLSLLVCVVGIINAQLMAVTERFREIGTMKCLGALDSFILRLFLLEALIQGFAGAGLGAAIGGVLALINGWLRFGGSALALIPWLKVGGSMATAVLVGSLLSLVGVLYPALLAARMQPVEAMRAEH